jgi:hypothetical protein
MSGELGRRAASVFQELEDHFIRYADRKMSYDKDSFTAIRGITNQISSQHPEISICHGIMFWNPRISPVELASDLTIPYGFAFGLSWSHDWRNSGRPPRRRTQFPSWTWIGWEGCLEPWIHRIQGEDSYGASDGLFMYQNESGDFQEISNFNAYDLSDPGPTRLFVSGKCYRVRIKGFQLTESGFYINDISINDRSLRHWTGVKRWNIPGLVDPRWKFSPSYGQMYNSHMLNVYEEDIIGLYVGGSSDRTALMVIGRSPFGHDYFERYGFLSAQKIWFENLVAEEKQFWLG